MFLSRTKRKQENPEISFRKALIEDTSSIYAISKKVYGIKFALTDLRERLEFILSQTNSIFYVAIKDKEVVGYIHADLHYPLLKSSYLQILSVVVDPEYQSHGIGTLLVHKAETWAYENNIHEMMTYCPDSHPDEKLKFFQQYNCDDQSCYYKFKKILD